MLKLLAVAPLLTAAALVTLTLPEPAWLMSMPLPLALSTLPAVVVTPIVPPDRLLITRIASPVVPVTFPLALTVIDPVPASCTLMPRTPDTSPLAVTEIAPEADASFCVASMPSPEVEVTLPPSP